MTFRDFDLESFLRLVCVWIVVVVVLSVIASETFLGLTHEAMEGLNVCEGWGCLPFDVAAGVAAIAVVSVPVAVATYWIWNSVATGSGN